jgi:hypothetical protein
MSGYAQAYPDVFEGGRAMLPKMLIDPEVRLQLAETRERERLRDELNRLKKVVGQKDQTRISKVEARIAELDRLLL